MSLYELIEKNFLDGGIILICLLTLIQIAPIKINPWSGLISFIGNIFNKQLREEIDNIKKLIEETDKKVNIVTNKLEEAVIISSRSRMLKFGDDVSKGKNHSKEHYAQILEDINKYEIYCHDNPNFKNNMTEITINIIKKTYEEKLKTNDFL